MKCLTCLFYWFDCFVGALWVVGFVSFLLVVFESFAVCFGFLIAVLVGFALVVFVVCGHVGWCLWISFGFGFCGVLRVWLAWLWFRCVVVGRWFCSSCCFLAVVGCVFGCCWV